LLNEEKQPSKEEMKPQKSEANLSKFYSFNDFAQSTPSQVTDDEPAEEQGTSSAAFYIGFTF
jgi:hypothetical protein